MHGVLAEQIFRDGLRNHERRKNKGGEITVPKQDRLATSVFPYEKEYSRRVNCSDF
jgi:hypothetical protein